MPRTTAYRTIALAALCLGAACTPFRRPAAAPEAAAPVGDTATRLLLRPVPVPPSYRDAVQRGTRTATGAPGPRYWQQRVRYRIDAELDPQSTLLRGRERIVYRNNSPVALRDVVLNLYQNIFTESVPRNRYAPNTGGITLERVAVEGTALTQQPVSAISVLTSPRANAPLGYSVQGTLGRLILPRMLNPGDSTVLEIDWHFKVPPYGNPPSFRTGWEDALGGRVLQVAQWYPQIAVYDDVYGWDATPYLGEGEFYLEYGDFDVALTLPAGWVVGATGTLRNPEQVLTPEAQQRLASATAPDAPVHVVTEADLAAGRATQRGNGRLTWRFQASDVRDFAFATSDRYLWDAARVQVPTDDGAGTRAVTIHSLYRPGAPGWGESARYGTHSIGFFSRLLIPYPYPQAVVSEGPIYGMEYPGLVFIARPTDPHDLYAVIAHELGHQWFPMTVGQNEAAYPWMDEGFTTFDEDTARAEFFPGSDPFGETRAAYLNVAGTEREVPLMRHTDLVTPYGARTVAAYSKPGVLLRSLRSIVGDTTFIRGMRTYAREWKFRHPYPWDYFSTMERVSGRDLDWFFYPWWFETGTLDYAIAGVEQGQGSVTVTLRDLGDIPAPVAVVVTAENGAATRIQVPIETWTVDRYRSVPVSIPVYGRAVRVEVDPEQLFPDVNRENNVWTPTAP